MDMAHIHETLISELLDKTDLVSLIDSYVPLKRSGKDFTACCPFHQEKTPSFRVSNDKQFYHCFGCRASGNAISFLMQYNHYDFVQTIEFLAQYHNLQLPTENCR